MFEQNLPLYRQAGDMLGAATTAAMLGHVLASQHQDARASELLEQTLAPLQEAGNDRLAGPSACSTCWTWRSCAISPARSGSAREITTAQRSCSPRP